MKVAVVTSQTPFIRGGAEYLAEGLVRAFRLHGHDVALIKIPFKWYPAQSVAQHMLAARFLRVDAGDPDLVVALKFPAYLAPVQNKKVWLIHQFRQVYDLWGTPMSGIPDGPEAQTLRDMVMQADQTAMRQARKVYTISQTVAGRLQRFNQIEADGVLYHPLDRPELFRPGEFGDYFFFPGRQDAFKRQHIAVEAMRYVRSPVRLVLAGRPDSDEYGNDLRRKVERWGLQDKVQFLGWISEEDKARWMAGCLAGIYIPYDEDSYGYVTLEAFHSHKTVLTFTDSGGTNELIEPGINGLSVEPTPQALAAAMETLAGNRQGARELGDAAHKTLDRRLICWEHVLDRLTAA